MQGEKEAMGGAGGEKVMHCCQEHPGGPGGEGGQRVPAEGQRGRAQRTARTASEQG